jgi:tRNA(fMet)-specific endonuclease VapC
MMLLDTDILTLLFQGHARVLNRMQSTEDDVATSVISWVEVQQGRFDAILKAADGQQLLQAQQRLHTSRHQLATLPTIPIDAAASSEFEKLLRNKKLKKIGRGDMLIASIVLAQDAPLVTRNLRDFQQVPGLKVESWAE